MTILDALEAAEKAVSEWRRKDRIGTHELWQIERDEKELDRLLRNHAPDLIAVAQRAADYQSANCSLDDVRAALAPLLADA